ncbi:MAG TPA: LPS assembly lipoprotein LptE [Usitatibacter sp.]|nr:LPS assembly lipoprotein LptE [Usitatibacter sp.]
MFATGMTMFATALTMLATAMTISSCGFQLRGEPEVGVHRLFISSVGPSLVQADIKRLLATGPTKVMAKAADAEAHLHILQETRDKTVYTITGQGVVYEFQLRLIVRYELLVPGREEPVVAPTTIETRRLITYSVNAPTAKETEEQLLFKDMQLDLAGQILRHVAAVKRDITQ